MTISVEGYRLDGLESDNPLAFLALLGMLRALEATDARRDEGKRLRPRASWDFKSGPVRPVVHVRRPMAAEALVGEIARGADILARDYAFDGRKDLDYERHEARALLGDAARSASALDRGRADILAALMTDVALKEKKASFPVDPTPFCLLFGQGHQHFLERLADVPKTPSPPKRGRGKAAKVVSAEECITEALFKPWHREDPTFSFRWDPEEAARYALMPGDPTDDAFKLHTQHGANRLAALGLAALTLAPETRGGRIRPAVLGGRSTRQGFYFAWPIWQPAMTLSTIRSILGHPDLLNPPALAHLGVVYTVASRRISVARLENFTRAEMLRPLSGPATLRT